MAADSTPVFPETKEKDNPMLRPGLLPKDDEDDTDKSNIPPPESFGAYDGIYC